MAKVYETQLDVERAAQKNLARKAHTEANHHFNSALIDTVIAVSSHTAEQLHQAEVILKNTKPTGWYTALNKGLMWVCIATGVYHVMNWFRASHQATAADARMQALGPEEIRSPANFTAPMDASPEANKHCDRLQQEIANNTVRSL